MTVYKLAMLQDFPQRNTALRRYRTLQSPCTLISAIKAINITSNERLIRPKTRAVPYSLALGQMRSGIDPVQKCTSFEAESSLSLS